MTFKLSLRPIASARSGQVYDSGKTFLYEVNGLPDGQVISIRNVRASVHEPVWEVGKHQKGRETRWTGSFKTAENALAHLQEEIDDADFADAAEV
jgi:hypothetical protein